MYNYVQFTMYNVQFGWWWVYCWVVVYNIFANISARQHLTPITNYLSPMIFFTAMTSLSTSSRVL